MNRFFAICWAIIVLGIVGWLGVKACDGIIFRTDLMALLPREEQDPALQKANDAVTKSLSQRVIIMVGSKNRDDARSASFAILEDLKQSDLVDLSGTDFSKDMLEQMGKAYFPYRSGLLSLKDQSLLENDKGKQIATRALAQAYGFMGISSPELIKNDPFLLLPAFFTSLPVPMSRLSMDDKLLTTQQNDTTWIMIHARLKGEVFSLDLQEQVVNIFNQTTSVQKQQFPELKILHTGAIFFAEASAKKAMDETSVLGTVSFVGTVILLIFFFRAISPLILSMLTVIVGMMAGFAGCLLIFKEIHVGTLLFGTSLIGIVVDYSLQYFSEIFSKNPGTPEQRLKQVLPGITMGLATTIIGYGTFLLAPFPGLKQVAIFSAIGLTASWLTVVLWLPRLDRMRVLQHGHKMLDVAASYLHWWTSPRYQTMRRIIFIMVCVIGLAGLSRFHVDDDVRHLQALPQNLVKEQNEIQALAGKLGNNQFFLIEGENEEAILQKEENLRLALNKEIANGSLSGFQMMADYVPSIQQQRINQELVEQKLYKPFLKPHLTNLQLYGIKPISNNGYLTPDKLRSQSHPPAFLSLFSLLKDDGKVMHVVLLDGIQKIAPLASMAGNFKNVRFIDPVADFSTLIGKYRQRAYLLLALSAALMTPVLLWRYGRSGLRVIFPPVLAVCLTLGYRALNGGAFTFFDAMALVLVLSIGVDYAIFCAESFGERRPVTMLAVFKDVLTTLLSFGLLAFSSVTAVQSFGLTMLIGITLAFCLAPIACKVSAEKEKPC